MSLEAQSFEPRRIAILGSTGSIGTQALDVVRSNPSQFRVEVLTANSNAAELIRQGLEFHPNAVVIANDDYYEQVFEKLDPAGIKVYAGEDALEQVVKMDSIELVLAGIVGFAGLKSTISAIEAGKRTALANKESLVVAGELVTTLAKDGSVHGAAA